METTSASTITGTREPKVLTRGEVEAFARNGYHFPERALTAEQAQAYRAKLEGAEARLGTPLMKTGYRNKPHLVFTWADELIRHPRILDVVEDILGPNLLVWSSSLFMKEARDPSFISWHQDSTYWGLSHPDVVTAWLALSVSHVANGCMRVAAGTHLMDQLPHQDTFAANNLLTRGQEVMVEVDESKVVNIELEPGEFSLHHVRIVHGSDPNHADYRRLGLRHPLCADLSEADRRPARQRAAGARGGQLPSLRPGAAPACRPRPRGRERAQAHHGSGQRDSVPGHGQGAEVAGQTPVLASRVARRSMNRINHRGHRGTQRKPRSCREVGQPAQRWIEAAAQPVFFALFLCVLCGECGKG